MEKSPLTKPKMFANFCTHMLTRGLKNACKEKSFKKREKKVRSAKYESASNFFLEICALFSPLDVELILVLFVLSPVSFVTACKKLHDLFYLKEVV